MRPALERIEHADTYTTVESDEGLELIIRLTGTARTMHAGIHNGALTIATIKIPEAAAATRTTATIAALERLGWEIP